MIRDRNLELLRKRIYIPWVEFEWQIGAAADDSATTPVDNGGIRFPAAGAGPLTSDAADNADETLPLPAAGGAFVAATGPYGFFPTSTGTNTPAAQKVGTALAT